MVVNTARLQVSSYWSVFEQEETNLRNIVDFNGQSLLVRSVENGSGDYEIDELYHDFIDETGDGNDISYNLLALPDVTFGRNVTKVFSKVRSFTIDNLGNSSIVMKISSNTGVLHQPFGLPSGNLSIPPKSILHVDSMKQGWNVSSLFNQFVIFETTNGVDLSYKMLILGNK